MPYQTPSASQYTQIKRFQSNISAKKGEDQNKFRAVPPSYGGYYAGIRLLGLPANALLSNKFIRPAAPTSNIIDLDFGGGDTFNTFSVPESTTFQFRFKNLLSGDYSTIYGISFSKIGGYDFAGSSITIPGVNITSETYMGFLASVEFNPGPFTADSIITLTVPVALSSIDDIIILYT